MQYNVVMTRKRQMRHVVRKCYRFTDSAGSKTLDNWSSMHPGQSKHFAGIIYGSN